MNNKIDKTCLRPFQLWVLNNFPFTIDDWDSITQYQMLCKIMGALKEQLDVNSDLYKKITDLENYLTNLDLQEYVDNKIEEMYENGELQEIITEYLQINGVLAFNTVSDMVSATNIIDGSICRTLGLNTYNDGKGAFYKIRTITSGDVVDGVNIVALNISNTLIAEKMPDYNITNLQNQITSNTNKLNLINNKKYLFVGDSLAWGYQGVGVDPITGFYELVTQKLGLNSTIVCYPGYGFIGASAGYTWQSLIENANITNKDSYTDIIIMGGDNDVASSTLISSIASTISYLKTNFINATIHLGCIGRKTDYANDSLLIARRTTARMYEQGAYNNGAKYIDNAFLILHHKSYFISDGTHLNSNGENQVAYCLGQYILNGQISDVSDINDISSDVKADTMTWDSNINPSSGFAIYSYIDKNNVGLIINGDLEFVENPSIGYATDMIIGKLSNSYVTASCYHQGINECFRVPIVNANNQYQDISVCIYNDCENNIHLKFYTFQDTGVLNNITIKRILLSNYYIKTSCDSKYC